MTEKELKDSILLAIYHENERDSELNVETADFCNQEKNECENDQQRNRILKSLRDDGYISANFLENGAPIRIRLTSKGAERSEELINQLENTPPGNPLVERITQPNNNSITTLLPKVKKRIALSSTQKWIIGIFVSVFLGLLPFICSKEKTSTSIDNSTINNSIVQGDNSEAVYVGIQNNNTYMNQPIVENDYGDKHRFKIANEISMNTPISYVKQHLGNPHTSYANHNIKGVKTLVYEYTEFCLKIETIDGETIKNLSFLLFDAETKIRINKTPINLGETTFGEICLANSKLNRWISNKGGGIQSSQYMANPGNYCYCNIGIYSRGRTNNVSHWLFIDHEENEDNTIDLKYYKDVKINFASIAREENELGDFNYDDFK